MSDSASASDMLKEASIPTAAAAPAQIRHHEWDDEACCVRCGFDGAEWHWWRFHTYEGRAEKTPMPQCREAA